MKKQILIFVDRDGTLLYDKLHRPKYHLGRQKNWKSKVRFIQSSITGLKLLNKKLPKSKIYLISNQPGIAIKEFPLLTRKRANEVFRYIIKKLFSFGVKLDGYEFCSKTPISYTKKRSQYKFDKKLVGNSPCFKPKTGMIKSILKKEGLNKKNTDIYVIGDRVSDVQVANNIKGFGIFVSFGLEASENVAKVKKLKDKKKYIAKNFLDAAKFIIKREK